MKIPLHRPWFDEEEEKQLKEVLDSCWLTKGPKAAEFEKRCAEYLGIEHAIAVTSCTAALHLALIAIGIKPGDEVLVADYTFPATGHAVLYCGATPVFVDISPKTYNIDPYDIIKKITFKTKAIIPVHTFGQPAKMNYIMDIAKRYDLKVIEDAACAFGSEYGGIKVGTIGDVNCFSFHVTKGLTTSEGGLITTNNKEIADMVRKLSVFGRVSSWEAETSNNFIISSFEMLGYNYKMTDLAAAIGLAQLNKLEKIIERKTALAHYWDQKLYNMELIKAPYVESNVRHNYQGYTALVDDNVNRNKVIEKMREQGVQLQIGTYCSWTQPVYKSSCACPVSLNICSRALRLPLYYKLKTEQIDHAAALLEKTLKECYFEKL